jgi:hypothetical protein
VGVRCALSFCPPLQRFSATLSPPPPIIPSSHLPPTAFARLKTLPAPSDRIWSCSCMMNAQLPLPPLAGPPGRGCPNRFAGRHCTNQLRAAASPEALDLQSTSISSSSESSKSSVVGRPVCLFRASPTSQTSQTDFSNHLALVLMRDGATIGFYLPSAAA